ncbi:DUF1127 domain-containing protein [Hoeflea ulvae]|uniref:DUF1127 domain-containing protein n=1 Tax=Hoeflea ulvae TaxID=2983764 RepID=A0ABT3YHN4_9HYPH|nr:DUF1127 domain-containing protein [Hoeflea ulvae]MCY0095401.1 DUF1127 domain-containing protein [Hoeflea ulvae]
MTFTANPRRSEISLPARQARWPAFPDLLQMVLVTWPERRRQRRHLGELADHHLRDIGLTRSQARQEMKRWFFD